MNKLYLTIRSSIILLLWIGVNMVSVDVFAKNTDYLNQGSRIAAHGALYQAQRMRVATENFVNAETTANTPGGTPYRRKVIVPVNKTDAKGTMQLLKVKKILRTPSNEFILKYDPMHPAADKKGFVKYPKISKVIEKADAAEAKIAYEANLSIIESNNSLSQKTIDLIK